MEGRRPELEAHFPHHQARRHYRCSLLFWRSPHFTYEYEYYIHIRKHADLQRRLLTMNRMKQLTLESELQEAVVWSDHRPTWFAPKPVAQYEVWVYSNAPNSQFRFLIDRETADLFLSDTQL